MTKNPQPNFEDKTSMLVLMREHLNRSSEDSPTYTYDLNWSDLLIAQSVNPDFKAYHAGTIRRMKFGPLARKPQVEPTPAPSRMDLIEVRLLRVIDILASNSPRSAQHRRYLLDGPSSTAHLDDI